MSQQLTAVVDGDYRTYRKAVRRRARAITAVLGLLALSLFLVTLSVGSFTIPLVDLAGSVLHLTDNPQVDYVVRELRLPTAMTALLVGLALGVSGTIFQQLLANPLASPDFVGVSSGASLAAVLSITALGFGGVSISVAALIGALVSSLLIYLLAWRDGIDGYRFILIGIGISEFLLSIVGLVLMRSTLNEARAAMTWLMGSVGQAGPGEIRALALAVAVLVPVGVFLHRQLRILELGDDTARGLGVHVEAHRVVLLGISIVLVAAATAAAGPIAFVALVAGPIAHRLLGASAGLLAAGLVGASVVLASDLVAQRLVPGGLPTGVITGAIGAPYLIWLLVTTNKEGRGG